HGWRASFSPAGMPGEGGNGGHLHFSGLRGGRNLFAQGEGPPGMTAVGEAFLPGVLAELPALMAVGAPSVPRSLPLPPSRWAGAYTCWGRENREAAMRFVAGTAGSEQATANCEVKCFDQSANPYLASGALIAAGLHGIEQARTLPPEVLDDPAALSQQEREALG